MTDLPLSTDAKAKPLPSTAKPIPSKDVSPAPSQPDIIPVGQEPRRHPCSGGGDHREAAGRKIASPDGVLKPGSRTKGSRNLSNPKKFFGLKDRMDTLRIFTLESMGTLRKSEIQVWLAIFNCEFNGLAQIGYSRLCEVTKLSRRHVGKAVASLESKALLKVVVRGRYRPSRNEAVGGGRPGSGAGDSRPSEAGLASTYRVHPRPNGHAKQATARPQHRKPKPR